MRALNLRLKLILAFVFLALLSAPIFLVVSANSQVPLSTVFIQPDGSVSPNYSANRAEWKHLYFHR